MDLEDLKEFHVRNDMNLSDRVTYSAIEKWKCLMFLVLLIGLQNWMLIFFSLEVPVLIQALVFYSVLLSV